MNRNRRFQHIATTGRLTLPVTILLALACCLTTILLLPPAKEGGGVTAPLLQALTAGRGGSLLPAWAERTLSLVLCSAIGYFLILLNNAFAIIRMRASVQTAVYFLLVAACPVVQESCTGNVVAVTFLGALFFLFNSYQRNRSEADLFHAFVCIGTGSLFLPQLTLVAPLFWIGAYHFQSLRARSFAASLVGWTLPYWFLFGHAYYHGCMEWFYLPFRQLAGFTALHYGLQTHEAVTLAYLFLLFAVSAGHCMVAGYEDKLRTRNYLHFLILLTFCLFLYTGLQPEAGRQMMPLLLTLVSILTGHLFVLTDTRSSNLFFSGTLVLLFLLFGYNLWELWQTR